MFPQPLIRPAEPRDRILALGLLLAGLLSRLPFLGSDEGWFDEHYSIITASQSAADIIRNAMLEQTNPPGYYLIAHLWGSLGDASLSWHRILPAVCGALVPAVTALAIRRFGFSRAAAATAALLLLVAPVPWSLSLEVRGYATLALLAACALYVAAGIIATTEAPPRGSLATLAVLHVALVLLHYYGAFAVLGVSLAVAEHARRRVGGSSGSQAGAWLRTATAVGAPAAVVTATWIALSFWAFHGAGGQNAEWIPETSTWSALLGISNVLLGNLATGYGTWMSRLLLLSGALAAAFAALRAGGDAENASRGRSTLLLTTIPLTAALLANALSGNELWLPRYVAVLTPALSLLIAMVVDATLPRWRRVTAIGIAAWWGVSGVHRFENRVPKPDWRGIIAALAPSGEATICADASFVGLPFVYQSNVSERRRLIVLNAPLCQPGHGVTWMVYDVKPTGVTPPPSVPGLVLGPRIVLFRGLQNLDARRVIARDQVVPR